MNTRTVDAKTQLDNQKKINETYYKENYEPLKAEYDNFILKGKESGLITENEKGQFVVDDSIFPQLEEYEAALNESQSEMSAISELAAEDLRDYQTKLNEEYARKSIEGSWYGAAANTFTEESKNIAVGMFRQVAPLIMKATASSEDLERVGGAFEAGNILMDSWIEPEAEKKASTFKVEGTTKEYIQEASKGGTANEVGLAIMGSSPAIIATMVNPEVGMMAMYGQMAESTYKSIEDNENLSEGQKYAYSAVSGAIGATLEKIGIDVMVGNNKLVNAVTQKYLRYAIDNGEKITLANATRFVTRMGVKGLGEGTTETAQAVADLGQRLAVNYVSGKELLDVGTIKEEYANIKHQGYIGTLSGGVISTVLSVAQTAGSNNELDPNVFKIGEEQAKRPDFIPFVKANLAAKVESGEITKEKADEYMDEAQKAVDAVSKVDEDLPIEKKTKGN